MLNDNVLHVRQWSPAERYALGETGNIAKIAELISNELFPEFFLAASGSMNEQWPCIKQDVHKLKTPPQTSCFTTASRMR
jgi:hypothetical protein